MIPNFNQIRTAVQQLKANPMQVLGPRFNLPQGVNINDPNQIIQGLLNSGQIRQQDLNAVVNNAMQMRNTIFKGLF